MTYYATDKITVFPGKHRINTHLHWRNKKSGKVLIEKTGTEARNTRI